MTARLCNIGENMNFKAYGKNADSKITVIERQASNGIVELEIDYRFGQNTVTEEFVIELSEPDLDVYSLWSPSMPSDRTIGKNYDWRYTHSRLAMWMPLHCAVSHTGNNRMTLAISDTATPTQIKSGICEEDAEFKWVVTFFPRPTTDTYKYSAIIRIDKRDIPLYDSVYDIVRWWEDECGYTPAPVPEYARLPMNSLWYSFHQVLVPDEIVKQCQLSKPLGLETVIIDDGWQTNDSNRGYAYCGDWEPVRMPDMKGLVDRIHGVGMKVMLWYSVPFIGKYAKRFDEFKDFLLNPNGPLDVYCLDPRYAHVREYLVNTYADAVKAWGLDGLKLDFIDNFIITDDAIKPDPRRDCESLEVGIDRLMVAVTDTLRSINPDILIEFRQSYVGPSIRKYGNMIRVGDCPCDSMANRRGVVDLRLTSGRTAVHSDMLMWNLSDTKENVASQLVTTLYGVPQISMLIDKLSTEHYDTLKFYLSFWREHREILLDGKLTFKNPETSYSQICSSLDGRAVVTAYENRVIEGDYGYLAVANASAEGSVILKGMSGKCYRAVDCTGEEISRGVIDRSICEISVSRGGFIIIE